MKRFASVTLIFTLLCIYSALTVAVKEPSYAELRCLETCQIEKHRHCALPPDNCGRCLPRYEERDGDCFSAKYTDTRQQKVEEVFKDLHPFDGVAIDEKRAMNSVRDEQIDLILPNDREVRGNSESSTSLAGVSHYEDTANEAILIAVIVCCSVAFTIGIVVAAVCWCRLTRNEKAVSEVDYPAYGSTGAGTYHPYYGANGDRKLAQSAQMFHYQDTKQKMLELEKNISNGFKTSSEPSSDGENDDEYTVYEYPGLATPGEMEVHNPLYNVDSFIPPGSDPKLKASSLPASSLPSGQ